MQAHKRTALAELLARTFPASAAELDPHTVDAFVDALMAVKTRRGEPRPAQARGPAGEQLLYRLRATHARRSPIVSVFTGETEAVRVPLGKHEPLSWDTAIGLVAPEDHLLPTVDAVRERFGDRIARPFEHVEVITPARYAFARFAPMAIYLGYEHEGDPAPHFYVFEAGTATGQPKVLYLGATLDAVVEERSGYSPTPLSSADNWYTGGLRFAANGNDPAVLYMRAAKERGGEPHLRLHVEYSLLDDEPTMIPAEDMVEAAMRMLAVQGGVQVEGSAAGEAGRAQNFVERLIGEAGLSLLAWVDRPDPPDDPERERERARHTLDAKAARAGLEAFVGGLSVGERELVHASIPMLLDLVVRAGGEFDRLERIEVDWLMNFEVPAQLGEAFRFSPVAERAYTVLMGERAREDHSLVDAWLDTLGTIVAAMPEALADHYRGFVDSICRVAAESSGESWFGRPVSEAEAAVLARIASALGLDRAG